MRSLNVELMPKRENFEVEGARQFEAVAYSPPSTYGFL
jgi:hypothetical protein